MKKFLGIVLVLAMVSTGAFAQDPVDITSAITNPSFEADTPTANEADYNWIISAVPTGWGGGPEIYNYAGVMDMANYGGGYGPATDGNNTLVTPFYGTGDGRYLEGINGEVYQTTTHTILTAQIYTTTADLMAFTGGASDNDLGEMILYYLREGGDDSVAADRIMIAQSTTLMVASNGGTNPPAEASVSFNSNSNPDAVGRLLGITLNGYQEDIAIDDTAWAIWDNVQAFHVEILPFEAARNITGSSAYAVAGQAYSLIAPTVTGGTQAKSGPFAWLKDGATISGATSGTLNFASLALDDKGTYRVSYDNELKAVVTSEDFILDVLPAGSTIPVTGLLGLGLLAGACALSGAAVLRRKK